MEDRDPSKPLFEFLFRTAYKGLLQNKALKTFLRPGDRSYPNPKSVLEGEKVLLRVIIEPGVTPIFDDFSIEARINSITIKKIKDLTSADLRDCGEDTQSPEAVLEHFHSIYEDIYALEDEVTIYTVEYL